MLAVIIIDVLQQHPFYIAQRPRHLNYPVVRAQLFPFQPHTNAYTRLSVGVGREKREVHLPGTDQ